jgi:N-acetyl-gamma-glutamylphosphate reductase
LIKGGAGQAIQNMNIRYNFSISKGLKWKSYFFLFF